MSKFITLLPFVLQKDDIVQKLADVLNNEISAIDDAVEKLRIYANIESLNEELIDELAYSFHVMENEGYRFADSIDKKRKLVKASLLLHKRKGTLYAVKEVLNILGIKGKISEWFEYDGAPYHFKIDAKLTDEMTANDITMLETLINEFKNVRSHLENITFNIITEGKCYYSAGSLSGEFMTVNPYVPHEIISGNTVHYGATVAMDERININPKLYGAINS